MNLLIDRTIEVRVGLSYSSVHSIENGIPQGSVYGPILFTIMINDIFQVLMAVLEGLYIVAMIELQPRRTSQQVLLTTLPWWF